MVIVTIAIPTVSIHWPTILSSKSSDPAIRRWESSLAFTMIPTTLKRSAFLDMTFSGPMPSTRLQIPVRFPT